MKKTLSVLLSLLMLLSIISGLSFSASAGYQSGYSYDVINGNEAEITAYTGTEMTTFNIPSNFGDYTVTSIGDGAFSDNDYMQTLNIPATINNIGVQAFECCAALSGVYIQSASLTIGENAFFGCSSLVTVNLGDGVTSIGANAFANCSKLININIPNTLTSIDAGTAFDGCTRMSSINVAEGAPNYYSENGVLFGRNGIGGDVSMLKYPEGKEDTNYAIPAGVKTLRYGALRNLAKLETLSVPTSVTSIDSGAVYNCPKLKDVYYEGTEAQWNAITIGTEENASLTSATMHFKSEPDPDPDPDPIVFPDVAEGDWYYEAVQYCASLGWITGYKNGKFGPADPLQRQDFVVILARIANAYLPAYTSCSLKDVDMNAYYGPSVAWAVSEGIIKGYDNGNFGVGDKITREQVCTILYRFKGSPSVDTSVLNTFPDKGSVSSFATDAMAWAVANGVITGKNGNLAPVADASRAEIATIIMRMDKNGMF
ncbi:MAG: leucine-rich repeat protein [Clostridiaceae bacterium]|nr:leucine-rich repeat protein [Clostridiaceae bacterium]